MTNLITLNRSKLRYIRVWLYTFSFEPSVIVEDFETHLDETFTLFFEYDEEKYEQVYRRGNVYIAVKTFFLKEEKEKAKQTIENATDEMIAEQTIKSASNATIAEVSNFKESKRFDKITPKDLTGLNIQYEKLSGHAYPYFTKFSLLQQEVAKQKKSGAKNFSLDMNVLSGYFKQAEEITFTKELERAQIFYEELKSKLTGMDLEVIHEYGKCDKEKTTFSKCGKSEIDIVLLRRDQEEEVYTAGAVIELKTTLPGPNTRQYWKEEHSQTAYEMLKLGTDMAIKDKLSHGEDVEVVIVHGILVYMNTDPLVGVVMELRLDFTQGGTSKCFVDERGRIQLKDAFPLVMGRLIPDEEEEDDEEDEEEDKWNILQKEDEYEEDEWNTPQEDEEYEDVTLPLPLPVSPPPQPKQGEIPK